MNIIRWIISAPVSVALIGLLCVAIEWKLKWFYRLYYYVAIWGTRYDAPPMFDFEYRVWEFKSFIFITCLSTLISAGIAGFIGGMICPKKHATATSWLMGVSILPVLIF